MELEHYGVTSVSGGKDAMAEATVRVATEFETYQGRGTDTDTVLASALAYLDVINRIERRQVRERAIAAQH
jgi:2-isopropylmalate synthase